MVVSSFGGIPPIVSLNALRTHTFPSAPNDYSTKAAPLGARPLIVEVRMTQLWVDMATSHISPPQVVLDQIDLPVSIVVRERGRPRTEILIDANELSLRLTPEQYA